MNPYAAAVRSVLADACPFLRPFAPEDGRCPAFRAVLVLPLTSDGRPLSAIHACGHFEAAPGTRPGRYYGRCALGDREARLSWVERGSAVRLARARRLGEELREATARAARRLLAAKVEELAGRGRGDAERAASLHRDLALAAERYSSAVERFCAAHAAALAGVGLTPAGCLDALRVVLARYVEGPTPVTPALPPEVVDSFPLQVWAVLGSELDTPR